MDEDNKDINCCDTDSVVEDIKFYMRCLEYIKLTIRYISTVLQDIITSIISNFYKIYLGDSKKKDVCRDNTCGRKKGVIGLKPTTPRPSKPKPSKLNQ